MGTTIPGGLYIVGKKVVDAFGDEVEGDEADAVREELAADQAAAKKTRTAAKSGGAKKAGKSGTTLPEGFPGAELLIAAKLGTVEKVKAASDEDILAIDGIGDGTLAKIREAQEL